MKIQTDKLIMANQSDIVALDKQQKKAIVINIAILSKSNIRKKEIPRAEKRARKDMEGGGNSGPHGYC